ncbi:MAG: Hsp70 family protein, partial [Holophaga sp.]|nr:Hsp70 family protein [Holophaga sp.]
MAKVLGIDLGTTKSVGAVWRGGKPEIIKDAE